MAFTRLVGVDADSHNIQIREKNNTHMWPKASTEQQPLLPCTVKDHDVHMPYSYLQNIDIMDQVMLSPWWIWLHALQIQ
jgi:hypothetical protein